MKKLLIENVTFKNFHASDALSQETLNFKADLYDEGKLIAHVSNDGHGGCNMTYPAKGLTHEDIAYINNIDAEVVILTAAERELWKRTHQTKHFAVFKVNSNGSDEYALFNGIKGYSFAKAKKKFSNYQQVIDKWSKQIEDEGWTILNTNL